MPRSHCRSDCHRRHARGQRCVLGLLASVACLFSPALHAQIYSGLGDGGVLVLSDFRSEVAPELLVGPAVVAAPPQPVAFDAPVADLARAASPPRTYVPAVPARYVPLIVAAARAHGVPAALVAAVAAAESGFDAGARSAKGAVGLMQLLPATARRFAVVDPFAPAQSLHGGAAYLRWLSGRFGGRLEHVLAAYNAGEQAVDRAGGMPPFAETRAYVPRVLALAEAYAAAFAR